MRNLAGACFAAALAMSGCSVPSQIEVINETGRTLEVFLDKERWVLRSTVLRIEPSRSHRVRLVRLRGFPALKIRSGRCEYVYDLPRLYPVNSRYVVRVQSDLSLVGLRNLWGPQTSGEDAPLQPATTSCVAP
ncbi:hypothetical protein [Phenylobacterium sp.]|uniref:hypothetical protein n=1 Tax=Phenylobacterium sp. TaxID=1871053 RepID=UPI003D26D1A8